LGVKSLFAGSANADSESISFLKYGSSKSHKVLSFSTNCGVRR
jgi:hypothetical protein